MQFYPSALTRMLIPVAMIVLAWTARAYVDQSGVEARVIVQYLPYLACLVAAFMAHQFSRCRLLMASCAVAFMFWLLTGQLHFDLPRPGADQIYLGVSLALPAMYLFLLLIPECGLWNIRGLALMALFVLVPLLSGELAAWLPVASGQAAGYYASDLNGGHLLSRAAVLLTGLIGLAGVVALCLRDDDTEAALLGAYFALVLALALLHLDNMPVLMCIAAGLCLVWGLVRSSHHMMYRDDLTGLLGRRALNERLRTLGRNYRIAMLDVDHFKRFNDTHGHDVGDEVLKLIASRLARVGGGGTAYRYGGEEFCIVFVRHPLAECVALLDEMREEIANYRMSIRDRDLRPTRARQGARRRGATRLDSPHVAVTVSIGVASCGEDSREAEAVVLQADEMLYRAKKQGRNRVVS